jgi:hypothetical protein
MHFKLKVFPYKLGSAGAKALATSLGVKRVRPTYDARRRDVIINWGNSSAPYFKSHPSDLNKHSAIALACNKLKTFETLEAAGFEHIPNYCTDFYHADQMLYCATNGGETLGKEKIYCRTNLTGHSGSGIVIASYTHELVDAPLYTLGTKHKHEFRVHVFKGEVLDVQQKKRKHGSGPSGSGIRNHANGWIYARCDIVIPALVLEASVNAVNILGLDFWAVDIGYREVDGKVFVFEVNTAPGLVGTTLTKYTNAFNNYLQGLNS